MTSARSSRVTLALALGVQRMARRQVLVRRLPALETLSAVTVICTDKTGTLTENRMTLVAIVAGDARWEQGSGTPTPIAVRDTLAAALLACPREAVDPQWLRHRKRLEGDLDNILLKALEKDIDQRYPSVEALARDIRAQIQKVFGGKVFKTVISKSVRLEESPAYRESIFTFAPDSTGASEYYSLCEEVIERA